MAKGPEIRVTLVPRQGRKKPETSPVYRPQDTGCPEVERSIEALYRTPGEEGFWTLMSALNYALQMETQVLVPLDADLDPKGKPVSWTENPVPAAKAKNLPLWPVHTAKGNRYLPVFTAQREAEAGTSTAVRPMAQLPLENVMKRALADRAVEGIVINPWGNSATLDDPLLNGLLNAEPEADSSAGREELTAGIEAARNEQWETAAQCFQTAADLGLREGMRGLANLLYNGLGVRRSRTEAVRLWKKAAKEGDVASLLALGEHASDRDEGEALQYFRRARKIAGATPDISYQPFVLLRIAHSETRYVSRREAMLQLAEAIRGFTILAREGDSRAGNLLDEAQKELEELFHAGQE